MSPNALASAKDRMAIFAIADLHLSHAEKKAMDVFGPQWKDHWQRIAAAWQQSVQPQDVVLIPGDISWAMQAQNAQPDLDAIGAMPGHKVLLRGNHDYWWGSLSRVRAMLPPGMFALQNDCVATPYGAVCGTRGWVVPGSANFGEPDQKIYAREVQRLSLSLADARKKGLDVCVVMMHFPPFNERREDNGFLQLFKAHGVTRVVYGHLHGKSLRSAFEGEHDGVTYELVSCDHLRFAPKRILG